MAERFRRTILALADDERFPHVKRRVESSVIVFGVWPAPAEPTGFGFHLIKGQGHLAALSGQLPDEMTTTAIPCVGLEQAIAAEQLWGVCDPTADSPEVPIVEKQKKPTARSTKKKRTTKAAPKRGKSASRKRS
jgi:hypothetical protein